MIGKMIKLLAEEEKAAGIQEGIAQKKKYVLGRLKNRIVDNSIDDVVVNLDSSQLSEVEEMVHRIGLHLQREEGKLDTYLIELTGE